MIDTQTIIILSLFYYYHYHHRYHYSYHNFIITILCYAPSVITCTVGGAIQMSVYIYICVIPNQFIHHLYNIEQNKCTKVSACTQHQREILCVVSANVN